jgi:mannose-1-phosphate guanylyltransferase / mannose-6-phosphate isomerase
MAGLITPLIVCGGSGTRLLPVSRESLPKQFLRLFGEHSTFQETVLRVFDPGLFAPAVVITHRAYQAHVERQLGDLRMSAEIVLEPERRGSGPAILAGAIYIASRRGGAVLALAADHIVRDVDGFHRTCGVALAAAEAGAIVTFGIVPDHPATGYGYIEPGEALSASARRVRRFVEKPEIHDAGRFVNEGFLWNSGNFLFQAQSLIDEYRHWDGETAAAVDAAVRHAKAHSNIMQLDGSFFARARNQSFDYAVMEKTVRAAVVPALHDWTDIGSWTSIYGFLARSSAGGPPAIRSLVLKPGEEIILPGHLRQSEYWIIASGTAIATTAGERRVLQANEQLHVGPDLTGRIENNSASDVQIIAVPAGTLVPE